MSDEKALVVQVTDLSKDDQDRVTKFIERGAVGFNLSDASRIARMMDLYLSGKTYSQIARIQGLPKDLVMCYSQKLNWYNLKMEYLEELELHLKSRVMNAKVASQDFLLQLTNMYQRKIGKKMDRYLKTDDEVEADKINLKEIDKYLKLVESLHKLSSEPSQKTPNSAVGLNVGDGVTITKTGENSVEITPKSKTIGTMLETLANQRREQELSKQTKTSDIKEETTTKVEGEEGNETK